MINPILGSRRSSRTQTGARFTSGVAVWIKRLCLDPSAFLYEWPECLVPCLVHSARRAGSLARRTAAGAEMAVVRFMSTCTMVRMRITELAIHCCSFIALPRTMQLCLSQLSQMSVFISQPHGVKNMQIKILALLQKEQEIFDAISVVCAHKMVANAEVKRDSIWTNTWTSSPIKKIRTRLKSDASSFYLISWERHSVTGWN